MEKEFKPWEAAHFLPDVQLGKCPWCNMVSDRYFVILFDGSENRRLFECEVVCENCAGEAPAFIAKKKSGWSRKAILQDFGWRK